MEKIKEYYGDLTITDENKELFNELEIVKGYLSIAVGVEFEAPYLHNIRVIVLYRGAVLSLPNLTYTTHDISLYPDSMINLPQLRSCKGIHLEKNSIFNAPLLYESENIWFHQYSELNTQSLTTVWDITLCPNMAMLHLGITKCHGIYLMWGSSLTLPNLTSAEDIIVRDDAVLNAPLLNFEQVKLQKY